MEGQKPYKTSRSTATAALSSGPRGIALIPTFAVATDADGLVINLYESGQASLRLHDGAAVTLKTETDYPASEHVHITVNPAANKEFTIKVRIPAWCQSASFTVAGQKAEPRLGPDGYAAIKPLWAPGDQLELNFPMEPRVIVGNHLNQGNAAVLYGPLVLAADDALLADAGLNVDSICLAGSDTAALQTTPEPASGAFKTWPGAREFRVNAIDRKTGSATTIRLVPFADAGGTGARYKVWLPLPRSIPAP
jgi:uncharacterized protein